MCKFKIVSTMPFVQKISARIESILTYIDFVDGTDVAVAAAAVAGIGIVEVAAEG